MIFKQGACVRPNSRCEYTVFIKDPFTWTLYATIPPPGLFVVIDKITISPDALMTNEGQELIQDMVVLSRQLGSKHICLWADTHADTLMPSWYEDLNFIKSAQIIDEYMQPMMAFIEGDADHGILEETTGKLPNHKRRQLEFMDCKITSQEDY